jgi:hypothetical protein
MKGSQTWMLQKENNAAWRESFFLEQTCFNVNNNTIEWKYTDLRPTAV